MDVPAEFKEIIKFKYDPYVLDPSTQDFYISIDVTKIKDISIEPFQTFNLISRGNNVVNHLEQKLPIIINFLPVLDEMFARLPKPDFKP